MTILTPLATAFAASASHGFSNTKSGTKLSGFLFPLPKSHSSGKKREKTPLLQDFRHAPHPQNSKRKEN